MKKPDYRCLPRSFYDRKTTEVAKDLLGKYLVRVAGRRRQIGRIVEVEAYVGPHDLACHSARGLTPRTKVMHGPPGHAYVYLIYGMYCCMNIVTEKEGFAAAVLIRALEPVENIRQRTQGPGLLCQAMKIDKRLNGHDLTSESFFVAQNSRSPEETMIARPRIGIGYAGIWTKRLLRFYLKGNAYVSKR